MSKQLESIIAIEDELLDLMLDEDLPPQVQQQIEKSCIAIMQARNLLQLSLEGVCQYDGHMMFLSWLEDLEGVINYKNTKSIKKI